MFSDTWVWAGTFRKSDENLIAANAVRGRYLHALRAADGGDYGALQAFVQS